MVSTAQLRKLPKKVWKQSIKNENGMPKSTQTRKDKVIERFKVSSVPTSFHKRIRCRDDKVEVVLEKLTMHSNSLGPTCSVPGVFIIFSNHYGLVGEAGVSM